MTDSEQLLKDSLITIESCSNLKELEEQRVALLGKKGKLTDALKALGSADVETKKTLGKELNITKGKITGAIETKKSALELAALNARLASEKVDVTLPVSPEHQGKIHPVSQVIDEITTIFAELGFSVAEGPDIEDDFHNFTALNIPESHPARQMHDTFYLQGNGEEHPVLRTHTSPVQIRAMVDSKPPFRILAPGSTYRHDYDLTHTPMFHQIEGLVIDKNIHMGHLKGTIIEFLKTFFELDDVPVRFRPSFFPFTEPSAEVDIGCARSKEALKIGAGEDWMEIMGCGMVHPNVLKNCNIDPNEYQGFAFGLGVERMAMLKYGIPDLRTFFENDARWLKHYGFNALHIPSLIGGL